MKPQFEKAHRFATAALMPPGHSIDEMRDALRECIAAFEADDAIKVSVDDDGAVWIHFFNPSGKSASICLDQDALRRPPITREALQEWCERQRKERQRKERQ
jgi:hypothetical protein